ncbi:hypothetical protein F7725_022205 [Dissostichus mawsoni]|uniref:Uncharacterized protein n=1 Tax=Dissostichus mawsoni TaxID=36200 RepID=A0A7J5YXF0_DISMA|nr:hypothetical protein F7725_022205 [Dissostichus mawsoni]
MTFELRGVSGTWREISRSWRCVTLCCTCWRDTELSVILYYAMWLWLRHVYGIERHGNINVSSLAQGQPPSEPCSPSLRASFMIGSPFVTSSGVAMNNMRSLTGVCPSGAELTVAKVSEDVHLLFQQRDDLLVFPAQKLWKETQKNEWMILKH